MDQTLLCWYYTPWTLNIYDIIACIGGQWVWFLLEHFLIFYSNKRKKNETMSPVQPCSADKPQAWWQPSLLPSFPIEPRWIVTSRCSPHISVPCQPQEPKIDADIRVQNPPMAPLSSQLRKHHCPSGTPSIDGWAAPRPVSRHHTNVRPGGRRWLQNACPTFKKVDLNSRNNNKKKSSDSDFSLIVVLFLLFFFTIRIFCLSHFNPCAGMKRKLHMKH